MIAPANIKEADPLAFAERLWPDVVFYEKQKDIIYSVKENDETVVPAGNKLGKDFVAGFIVLWAFLCHKEVRVVTTSVRDDHLRVLWGEIGRFIQTAKHPLLSKHGGPLIVNHREIKKVSRATGEPCKISYLIGTVSEKGEGMAGHHAPYTLLVTDESSGIDEQVYIQGQGWAEKFLIFGNPNPCNNFFYRKVKEGDKEKPDGSYYQKVIKIRADDSPNVIYGKLEVAKGRTPSNKVLLPGVLTYKSYENRRRAWELPRQCVGLDAEFYEGAEIKLFPPEWLMASQRYAEQLANRPRKATSIGIDPAEGGDSSVWSIGDELGLIKQYSRKTPDTADIPNFTIDLIHTWNVDPENVYFDAGGGGKQHADYLRSIGYNVQTVAFGASASEKSRDGHVLSIEESIEIDETRYIYKNRRAELYGELRLAMSPIGKDSSWEGFAIPAEYAELFRQLKPLPLLYDGEGRLYLPPKTKRPGSKVESIQDMIGCSPDEADSLVLMNWGLVERMASPVIGSMI